MVTVSRSKPLILHAFSTFKLGGPQARFVSLANSSGQQFQHQVLAMDGCYDAGERLDNSVDWRALKIANQRGGALANRGAFREILRNLKPDLLLTYNWGAIEWAAANCPGLVPHIHVEDGFGPEEAANQLPRRVWTRRVLLAMRRVPTVVASRNLGAIATNVWRLPNSRVCFIPNGVDLPRLSSLKGAIPKRPDAELVIGTVAGLRPEKNIARLIKAFAKIVDKHPARLLIIGDGAERASLEALVRQLGIQERVEFAGYLKDPAQRLAEIDLFALSSDTEQLPISMLEAMACGMPVVSTRVGDVASIIPDIARSGLAEPTDRAFEEALRTVLAQRSEWPAWIQAGQAVIENQYQAQQMLSHWNDLFAGRWQQVFAQLRQPFSQ